MTQAATAAARARLVQVGQGHLAAHAATLGPEAGATFLCDAALHPWEELTAAHRAPPAAAPGVLRPPAGLTWKRQLGEGGLRRRLADQGRRLLAGGRVATVLLAGGEGSRLGIDGPKGDVVLGPTADRTLYRVLAERVVRAGRDAGHPVPLVVLTSERTHEATAERFLTGDRLGLEPGQAELVQQGRLPVLDDEGRALLAASGQLLLAPDGHGGLWTALRGAGVLERLRAAGVEVLTTFQVDNPLGLPLDPVMLGWMLERRANAVSKAVAKTAPDERVGVYARGLDGRTRIVEYSELPADGAPGLKLGSIAVHAFALRWLDDLFAGGWTGPLHRAHKQVAAWTPEGPLEATGPNAWKMERFLFDVLPEAPRVEVLEVAREREFAPVKNAEGADSLASARLLVDREVLRWHTLAGSTPPRPLRLAPLEIDASP
jgi:UDP-N-acetylglucosamine/UDP-N-acetylgalactosamine diphosphorylase